MPTKKDIQDLYFMDTRYKLLDVAAYLDRVDRHEGEADFRHPALIKAISAMLSPADGQTRNQAVHLAFSDHSEEPIPTAGTQGASGANPE